MVVLETKGIESTEFGLVIDLSPPSLLAVGSYFPHSTYFSDVAYGSPF